MPTRPQWVRVMVTKSAGTYEDEATQIVTAVNVSRAGVSYEMFAQRSWDTIFNMKRRNGWNDTNSISISRQEFTDFMYGDHEQVCVAILGDGQKIVVAKRYAR